MRQGLIAVLLCGLRTHSLFAFLPISRIKHIAIQTSADVFESHNVDEATELGVLRLHSEGAHPQGLTQAQRETFDSKGYLVLPDVLTVDQATALLNESRDIMKRIAEGGKGIIRHDVSDPGAEGPSPIGRVLATFEPGKYSG